MTETAILLDSVRFNYGRQQGDSWDLAIPTWQIKTGESVFLHGPSGAGKTTLLNLISGVLNLQEGDIQVLKTSLPQLSARQRDRFRANHIGYVFQQFNLVPYLNAIENIQLARFFSNKTFSDSLPAEALLRDLQIEASVWQRPTSKLSLGQQQRVAIARAMINQPEVLIVDEPTSSLDKANRDRFMNLLMKQIEAQSTTLLFVSHDLALSTYFSRVDDVNDLIE